MTATLDLLLRANVSRGRLLATTAAGAVLVLLAVAVLAGDGSASQAIDLVENAGTALLVPVVAVVFATAMLGDPADDGTIGFLLTTPQPRWRLAVPAYLASIAVVGPAVTIPIAVAVAINALGISTVVALSVSSLAGVLAYCAVFLPLGLLTRRSLLIGLLYSAIWEGVIAGVGEGLARLSIRHYVVSLAAWLQDDPVPTRGVTGPAAVLVLGVVVAVGLSLTTWLLRRHTTRG